MIAESSQHVPSAKRRKGTTRLSVDMTRDDRQRLAIVAAHLGCKSSPLVRQIIAEEVRRRERELGLDRPRRERRRRTK